MGGSLCKSGYAVKANISDRYARQAGQIARRGNSYNCEIGHILDFLGDSWGRWGASVRRAARALRTSAPGGSLPLLGVPLAGTAFSFPVPKSLRAGNHLACSLDRGGRVVGCTCLCLPPAHRGGGRSTHPRLCIQSELTLPADAQAVRCGVGYNRHKPPAQPRWWRPSFALTPWCTSPRQFVVRRSDLDAWMTRFPELGDPNVTWVVEAVLRDL